MKNSTFGEIGITLCVLTNLNIFDTEGESFLSNSSHTAASELLDNYLERFGSKFLDSRKTVSQLFRVFQQNILTAAVQGSFVRTAKIVARPQLSGIMSKTALKIILIQLSIFTLTPISPQTIYSREVEYGFTRTQ